MSEVKDKTKTDSILCSQNPVKIISLMRHSVDITTVDGDTITIKPSGQTTGLDFHYKITGVTAEGVPIFSQVVTAIHHIPKRKEGVVYLVPSMVKNLLASREDIVALHNIQRDGKNVVGAQGIRTTY